MSGDLKKDNFEYFLSSMEKFQANQHRQDNILIEIKSDLFVCKCLAVISSFISLICMVVLFVYFYY